MGKDLMLLNGECGGPPTCGTALNPTLDAQLDPGEYALVVDGQDAQDAGGYRLRVTVEAR